jgi:hypothetical protein
MIDAHPKPPGGTVVDRVVPAPFAPSAPLSNQEFPC